jgi:uncharacterized protein
MELSRLIAALSDPSAYPHPVDTVEVHQTHISVVFLAGAFAYKVKKPVALGFLDYGTPTRRRHFCHEEYRLNHRLSPEVYLGVVPITRDGETVRVEGQGEVVEWAVKMTRLPEDATLRRRLEHGEVDGGLVEMLARRVAEFHVHAQRGDPVTGFGRFEVVARNARENFEQSEPQVGSTISRSVFERLRALTEERLSEHRGRIEDRAARHVPCDTHGDLRLDHVYYFPDQPPPSDLVIVDCIEFNERFRYADPVADMAFLVMDLARSGRRDLARVFADAYFAASGDADGRALLPFYTAYRAAVRGKVEGIEGAETEVPEPERASARERARAHWLLALGELETPERRPCLLLVGGLPGTGKSTLARGLSERAGFAVIRSDVVRKEIAGAVGRRAADFEAGIYSPEWTERTYLECSRRAAAIVFEGGRVLIDASFRAEAKRNLFLRAAIRWGVPGLMLLCRAEPDVVHDRLRARREDASDADWPVYLQAAQRWEPFSPRTRRWVREIITDGGPDQALGQALRELREQGLAGG